MRKSIAIFSSVLMFATAVPASFADVIGSGEVLAAQQQQYERQQLLSLVDSETVYAQLVSLGVDTEIAKQRIANMTSTEISALNSQMQDLPAAGSVGGTIVTVLLVIAVLDLLGVTDVYPFIDPI